MSGELDNHLRRVAAQLNSPEMSDGDYDLLVRLKEVGRSIVPTIIEQQQRLASLAIPGCDFLPSDKSPKPIHDMTLADYRKAFTNGGAWDAYRID